MNEYFGHGATPGMNYFGMGTHWFAGVIVILLITLLVVALLRYGKKNKDTSTSAAEETLKMRYVNGEITEEEYQKMKKMIQ
jgi:putative membrane protein